VPTATRAVRAIASVSLSVAHSLGYERNALTFYRDLTSAEKERRMAESSQKYGASEVGVGTGTVQRICKEYP
jgi:hypothetical protein